MFAIFHGAGNGILTIARGTLPLAIFGPQNYGYRLGIIGAPARMAQAAAPLLFSLLIDTMGSRVLIVSSALSLSRRCLATVALVRAPMPAPADLQAMNAAATCALSSAWSDLLCAHEPRTEEPVAGRVDPGAHETA